MTTEADRTLLHLNLWVCITYQTIQRVNGKLLVASS